MGFSTYRTGDLTIHGVARPVVLDTRYLGQAKHPFSGKIAAAFRAETANDRRDFGVTWNARWRRAARISASGCRSPWPSWPFARTDRDGHGL
jgi:polyisoprenoid-binding protein YceI